MDPSTLSALATDSVFHGRYRVVRCISAGGMGAVYEVLDLTTDRRRALKIILPNLVNDADMRARFEREARVTGSIDSDHLVQTSDAGVDAETSTPFIVMDLLRGNDFGTLLEERGRLSGAELVGHLVQVARALDKTHAAGIIHRDLKPQNLFLTVRDDGTPCVKILDFGIAKVVASNAGKTRATRSLGTPMFMAPEQVLGDGKIGPGADIYALGQIAYAALVGEAYWEEEGELIESHFAFCSRVVDGVSENANERANRRKHVVLPLGFDEWFAKACARVPTVRFESASSAVAALAALVTDAPQSSGVSAVTGDRHGDRASSVHDASTRIEAGHRDVSLHDTVPHEETPSRKNGTQADFWRDASTGSPRRSKVGVGVGVVAVVVALAAASVLGWRTTGTTESTSAPRPVPASTATATAGASGTSAVAEAHPEVVPASAPTPVVDVAPSASGSISAASTPAVAAPPRDPKHAVSAAVTRPSTTAVTPPPAPAASAPRAHGLF